MVKSIFPYPVLFPLKVRLLLTCSPEKNSTFAWNHDNYAIGIFRILVKVRGAAYRPKHKQMTLHKFIYNENCTYFPDHWSRVVLNKIF